MNELLMSRQTQHVHLLLDQILNSLHVVVGRALDLLNAQSVLDREVAVDVA